MARDGMRYLIFCMFLTGCYSDDISKIIEKNSKAIKELKTQIRENQRKLDELKSYGKK